jgi:hypothetical protein
MPESKGKPEILTVWYQHPRGTVALKASAADLSRDGIDVNAPTARAVPRAKGLGTPAWIAGAWPVYVDAWA